MERKSTKWVRVARISVLVAGVSLMIFTVGFLAQGLVTSSRTSFDQAVALAQIFAFALAAFAASFTMIRFAKRPINNDKPDRTGSAASKSPLLEDGDRLDGAAKALATAVRIQWEDEVNARGLARPEPLNVRWSSSGRPSAHPSLILGDKTLHGLPVRLRLHGDLMDMVERFNLLPHRQLAIIGEPGAGKSVLATLFTVDYLRSRSPSDLVPILLYLATWRPGDESLYQWMARRLTEDYPFLRNARRYGSNAALKLVTTHRVIPVLDGLDELPVGLHALAIEQIDREIAGGPMIVTCRSQEYQEAVERGGRVLSTAAVVELEPIEIDDAAAYLSAIGPSSAVRWRSVVNILRGDQDSPLAKTLTSPLMVGLARTIYTSPTTNPQELLEISDQANIEESLLGAFIPAAYQSGLEGSGDRLYRSLTRYKPENAHRWLVFIASHLQKMNSRDLAWWQIENAIPRTYSAFVAGGVVGLVFAIAGAIAGGTAATLTYATAYGAAFAVATGLSFHFGARRPPSRVEVRLRGTARPFLTRFIIGEAIGLALGDDFGLSWSAAFAGGLPFGFALGSYVWLDKTSDPQKISSPGRFVAQDRIATLAFGLSVGSAFGVVGGLGAGSKPDLAFHVLSRPISAVVTTLVAILAGAIVGGLAYGRIGLLTFGVAGVAPGGLVFGPAYGIVFGVAVGVGYGITFGLGVAIAAILSRPWGSLTFCRIWLALSGQIPWRLLKFLDDARDRGVLRQTGGTYQFRHARLQDYLARVANADRDT